MSQFTFQGSIFVSFSSSVLSFCCISGVNSPFTQKTYTLEQVHFLAIQIMHTGLTILESVSP